MTRTQLSAYINTAIYGIIILVTVVTPSLFANFTSEYFEAPKIIFLISATLVMLVLWTLSWLFSGRVTITRTPLDLSLILLLAVLIFSAFFSESKYIAILGNFPRIHGSAVSWVTYILFFFVVASNIRNWGQIKTIYYSLTVAAILAALISLLSYFGLFLPIPFAKAVNFTPTGSSFSTSALLALLLPVTIVSIVNPNRFLPQYLAIPLLFLFGLVIALTGDLATYLGAVMGLLLTILFSKRSQVRRSILLLGLPVILVLLVVIFSFVPMGKSKNPLMQKRDNFPREIQLPFSISWKISASAFRDAPFLGTGPSTYLFNFTSYKPGEFNQFKYWNLRFDQAFNEFLQFFGTIGILGLLAFIVFSIMVLNLAWTGLSHPQLKEAEHDSFLTMALSISAIVAVVILAFHVSSLVLIVTTFLLLALLMVMHKLITGKAEDLTIGIKAMRSSDNMVTGDILPVIFLIPIVIAAVVIGWYLIAFTRADYYHRQALNAASQPNKGSDTYRNLVLASTLNPWVDLYRTDLAQTNFAIANAIASQKGPTEASPGGSLTDKDKADIRALLSQAIAEAKNGVALSPKSAQNWEILGAIYRQISGVAQNALAFSLDAYGRAIQRDPLNPLLRLNAGGIYYSIRNYDLAIRFFSDAVNLKPDFANGYYNLSVAFKDKGDLQSAKAAAEQVVSILQKNTDNLDYKTASEYLADLKTRIATGSADQTPVVPPAAAENGVLQNKNLPKLPVDLQEKESVATPEAVKKNPKAEIPQSSSSPEETSAP